MHRFYRSLFLLLFLLPVSTLVAAPPPTSDEIAAVELDPPGGDFTLQSSKGPVSLRDLRGKVVLLFFGYTRCPDVCPTTLAFMAKALNALSEAELKNVQGLFISVDPKSDTPEILDEYVAYFHPNLTGLTGSEQDIAEVAARYGAKYYEVELEGTAFGYAVNHSAATYLITPNGTLQFIFPHATPSWVVAEAIRRALAEEAE